MYNIDMEFVKGIFVVRLSGNFNKRACTILEEDLNQLITTNGIKFLLINLNDISSIDNKVVEIIFENYVKLLKKNGKLIICGINKLFENNQIITKNLLQVTKEQDVFDYVQVWQT